MDGATPPPGIQFVTRSAFVDKESVPEVLQILAEVSGIGAVAVHRRAQRRRCGIPSPRRRHRVRASPGGADVRDHPRRSEAGRRGRASGSGRDLGDGSHLTSTVPTRTSSPPPPRRMSPRSTRAETYERLAAVKRRYDPGNLFARNHNVQPRQTRRTSGVTDHMYFWCPLPQSKGYSPRGHRVDIRRRRHGRRRARQARHEKRTGVRNASRLGGGGEHCRQSARDRPCAGEAPIRARSPKGTPTPPILTTSDIASPPSRRNSCRIDFCISARAVALTLAGVFFALYPLLRPWHDEATSAGARASMSSDAWLIAHLCAMLGFALLPWGYWL